MKAEAQSSERAQFSQGSEAAPRTKPSILCLHLRVPSKKEELPGLILQYQKARVPANRETLTLSQRLDRLPS